MRIVDRKTFLALPAGTIYAKFGKQPRDGSHINLTWEEVAIKGETVGSAATDWLEQELFPWFEDVQDGGEHSEVLLAMLKGEKSPPLDYHCECRDGLFDEDQLFAVWDRDDAVRLVERLQEALKEGYPE